MYLTDEEAEALRRVATATGRSQAELIREGIRRVLASPSPDPGQRQFYSLGKGRGSGEPYLPWDPDNLYRKAMGQHE